LRHTEQKPPGCCPGVCFWQAQTGKSAPPKPASTAQPNQAQQSNQPPRPGKPSKPQHSQASANQQAHTAPAQQSKPATSNQQPASPDQKPSRTAIIAQTTPLPIWGPQKQGGGVY